MNKKIQPNIDTADGRRLQKESPEHLAQRQKEEKEALDKYNADNNSKILEEGPRRTRH